MRIIAGTHRGRSIHSPRGRGVRPTSDRVRESYFNIIGQYFEGVSVLDLYCGTGAIGFEFLSRGAGYVCFVDISSDSISCVRKNAQLLGFEEKCEIFTMNASDFISSGRGKRFDYIFIDPPYREDISDTILKSINGGLLSEDGLLTVEHGRRRDYPDKTGELYLYMQRRFGDTILSFYSLDPCRYKEKI